jgi:hypothetical protein
MVEGGKHGLLLTDLEGGGRPWGNKKTNKWLEEIENKNKREGECQNARVDHRE